MPISAARKVLVIQTAFLGDIVLSTSFLANLRRLLPTAEIRFLTTPAGAKVLSPNSFGVAPLAYDKRGKDHGFRGFLRTAKSLREFSPDLVFCLHRSVRSILLARVSGGETWGFQDAAGSVLLDHRIVRPRGAFEAEKNHALLEAWAGEAARSLPLFPRMDVSAKEEAEGESLVAGLGAFVAMAPSSVWATKRWPADRFAQLAALLWQKKKLRTVVVGGSDASDLEVANSFRAAMEKFSASDMPLPLNLMGKTGLGALKSVLSRASLVIANDSAPLHVAIAAGVPVLGIFGPTTKELGFFPLAPKGKSGVVELAGLACRPCGLHGHHSCPEGHFRCMLELGPDKVFEEAEKLLCP